MSTHNICFCGEIRKIITGYPILSRPMMTPLVNLLFTWRIVLLTSSSGTPASRQSVTYL